MVKNDILTGVVGDLGYNFEGIVKIDGYTCFVPLALKGEKVKFKVLKVSKNLAYCKLLEVLTPSQGRVRPQCDVYGKCGGCSLQHISYKRQLKFKTDIVKTTLQKVANLDVKMSAACESNHQYNYRNKLQLPVREGPNGVEIGFFANNSHRVVPIKECAIQQEWNKQIISTFFEFLYKFNIPCYNDETGKGIVRHIIARNVYNTLMIVVVINADSLPHVDSLVSMLQDKIQLFSLFININKQNNNVITSDNYSLVYGPDSVYLTEQSIKYKIVPQSFMQVNDYIKSKIYAEALRESRFSNNTVVIDAYSGAGLLTGIFAKVCKKAIGIEVVKEAVDSANELMINNGLENKMRNYCGNVEDLLPEIVNSEKDQNSQIVVVLDPPRKGCDYKVIETLKAVQPDRIIYISCSPQTLSRDVGIFMGSLEEVDGVLGKKQDYVQEQSNYIISHCRIFDMFAQTQSVETLMVLTRKDVYEAEKLLEAEEDI